VRERKKERERETERGGRERRGEGGEMLGEEGGDERE